MKRCPSCARMYSDDSLKFCLEDGSPLSSDTAIPPELAATLIIPEPRATVPAKPEVTYQNISPSSGPPRPQYAAPAPAWMAVGVPPVVPTLVAREGRGAAVTSLTCAIAAYFMLGFCILAGASEVNPSLIGGIFLLSALIGLAGAILGIVAGAKAGRHPQSSKTLGVVGLVLNCIYLTIVIIFLVVGAVASSS